MSEEQKAPEAAPQPPAQPDDAAAIVRQLYQALNDYSADMTVGQRWTNEGQAVLDALAAGRAWLEGK